MAGLDLQRLMAKAMLSLPTPLLRAMSANTLLTATKYCLPSNARLIQKLVAERRALAANPPFSPVRSNAA